MLLSMLLNIWFKNSTLETNFMCDLLLYSDNMNMILMEHNAMVKMIFQLNDEVFGVEMYL